MDLTAALIDEFANRRVLHEQFPMLTRQGISDTDVNIHSHFLSYLAALAQPLGYSGIVECSLPISGDARLATLNEVRSDVVWFVKTDNMPIAAFEFERFERGDEAKLRHKIENLDIAYLRSGRRLQLAVLVYWVRSGTAPQVCEVAQGYRIGFTRNGVRIPAAGCPLRVFKCSWRTTAGGLVVSDILPVEVI